MEVLLPVPTPSNMSSATLSKKPSVLLAIICAAIIGALHRDWLSKPVKDLGADVGLSAQRVSRLKGRLLPAFEELVAGATRRGRPSLSDDGQHLQRRIAALESLLAVTRAVNGTGFTDRPVQDQLVAAAERLKEDHGVTQKDFCSLLGIPERTFRYWGNRVGNGKRCSTQCVPPKEPKKTANGDKRNVGRFDLEHTLPGVQAMADTTDWKLFGLKFKIVGVQDPGARDERLWEGFSIEDHEDAEIIIKTVKEVIEDPEAKQFISDQGRPYLAEKAREAYQALGLEHEPTKEGAPTEKATLERSFGVVKDALQPIADLTNKLVETIPSLCNAELARSVGRLLVTTFLSVYAAAARVRPTTQRPGDPEVIAAVVQEQRDSAKAEGRSRRLILERIHEEYRMEGSRESFVNAHRKHALEDIKEADRRLRSGRYACRCQTKCCDRYFAAILRNVADEGRKRRATQRREFLRNADRRREFRQMATREAQLENMPEENIYLALDELKIQWNSSSGVLVANGRGPARGRLIKGLRKLEVTAALPADAAQVIWKHWQANQEGRDQPVVEAVKNVFDTAVQEVLQAKHLTPIRESKQTSSRAKPASERPPSQDDLRNYEAKPAGS